MSEERLENENDGKGGLQDAVADFLIAQSAEKASAEHEIARNQEIAKKRGVYLAWHRHWDQWETVCEGFDGTPEQVAELCDFIETVVELLRKLDPRSYDSLIKGELKSGNASEDFFVKLVAFQAQNGRLEIEQSFLSLSYIPPLCGMSVHSILAGNAVVLPRVSMLPQKTPSRPFRLIGSAGEGGIMLSPGDCNLESMGGDVATERAGLDSSKGGGSRESRGLSGRACGYEDPKLEERDKWIYENVKAGRKNQEVLDELCKIGGKFGWEILTSVRAISSALNRYCTNTRAVPLNRKKGRPRKNNRKR
ncbi:hypothetical protein [Gimesia maris]|uniref:hypothetical protein n=1 Tax=Planctomycetia TaxID=203683 RepID=UPI003A8E9D92